MKLDLRHVLLNKDLNVEVSDTTKDDSST